MPRPRSSHCSRAGRRPRPPPDSTQRGATCATRSVSRLIPMRIPVVDSVLDRFGRRDAGLERIEELEDEAAEPVDADNLRSAEPALLLQRMENRLIRHHLAEPDTLSADDLRRL